jgi:hypothetical protein
LGKLLFKFAHWCSLYELFRAVARSLFALRGLPFRSASLDILQPNHAFNCVVGPPRAAYREAATLRKPCEVQRGLLVCVSFRTNPAGGAREREIRQARFHSERLEDFRLDFAARRQSIWRMEPEASRRAANLQVVGDGLMQSLLRPIAPPLAGP